MFEKVINELKDTNSDQSEEQDAQKLGTFLFNAKGIDK